MYEVVRVDCIGFIEYFIVLIDFHKMQLHSKDMSMVHSPGAMFTLIVDVKCHDTLHTIEVLF